MYAVEMRGFMPTLDGQGEDAPVGRVVVLEDLDGDGVMDRNQVFLDGLVLPRAIAVLPEGVLLGVPPDLWLCRDTQGDLTCDEKQRLGEYGIGRHDPEHLENALLPGIDGWIYNAKSARRFRFQEGGAFQVGQTAFRGQWGLGQDPEGRLLYNHNSAFLFVDLFPAEYLLRHPATDPRTRRPGLGVALASGESFHAVRVAPGLNRAYLPGTLRADGRQGPPTGVSGLAVNRGDGLGPDALGDVFVPEAAGWSVARLRVAVDGLEARAQHLLSPDPEWGEREFLASPDERFRPVNAAFGPDGALYVVDMYRGVIQHANYVSDHLREHARRQDLEAPLAKGRIWRIRPEAAPAREVPDASLATPEQRVALLGHGTAWVRDRAQRWLVYDAAPAALPALRNLTALPAVGRIHALWTLAGLGALDEATWRIALEDPDPGVRRAALRVGEALLRQEATFARIAAVVGRASDPDAAVRLQALHSLGEVPLPARPIDAMLAAVDAAPDDPMLRQAVLSGLSGAELQALEGLLGNPDWDRASEARERWLAEIASAVLQAAVAQEDPEPAGGLLDLLHAQPTEGNLAWRRVALLAGVGDAVRRPAVPRFELSGAHPLFDAGAVAEGTPQARALAAARRGFTWPGDPNPSGLPPLSDEQRIRAEAGAELFAQSCASCHGPEGRGQPGLAPTLVGSPWVLDAEGWLIRIALHGIMGELRIGDEVWNLVMPPHGHDPRFSDEALAGLLTHLRRSWGNAAGPVEPERVAAVRAAEASRTAPWTAAELLEVPVAHRLDRMVGSYGIPLVPVEMRIERERDQLFMEVVGRAPRAPLTLLPDGSFAAGDPGGAAAAVIEFDTDETGTVTGARLIRDGEQEIPFTKEG
jgi:mono/diheme cytochrome c family protein